MDEPNSENELNKEIEQITEEEIEAEAKRLYSVNESLLQSYRRIFISSESFLLSVGFLQFGGYTNDVLFYIVVIMNLIIITVGWVDIVRARAKMVDYYKFSLKKFCNLNDFLKSYNKRKTTFKEYNEAMRKKYENWEDKKSPWRETRLKIDFGLPALYLIVWMVLFFTPLRTSTILWSFLGIHFYKPLWIVILVPLVAIAGIVYNLRREFGE